jgi:alpha-amylase/alpha-mannosidase (GH57 family)
MYVDSQKDWLTAPWVRTHATKDYYDMAAMLSAYPEVHCTINLTTSLLIQLHRYYIDRLRPCIDRKGDLDLRKYEERARGRIDPWFDLLLKPANEFDDLDVDYLLRNPWNALTISEVLLERFPEYEQLKFRLTNGDGEVDEQTIRDVKFWFFLAYFDPDFFDGAVHLPSGEVCDLSDLVRKENGKYFLRRRVEEGDCRRVAAETYRVIANIVPIHRMLGYDTTRRRGQIELTTTPYTHPILPLIVDSDVTKVCQPHDALPPRFAFPDDAALHVKKAIVYFRSHFGFNPTGMWPAEGSVSDDVIPIFAQNGIRWVATDRQILDRSLPAGLSHLFPHRCYSRWADVAVLFRDTHLSDKIGFSYQTMQPQDAVDDFVQSVVSLGTQNHSTDKLVTVILDGENAWEWYRFDHDGKRFLNTLYERLQKAFVDREIITVTPTEYMLGNPERDIPPHPPSSMPVIESLWPGSWINSSFDTWIGEEEENRAWEYLRRVRADLERSGIPPPVPSAEEPPMNTREWFAFQAWESMLAAEGSDWFWWYGEDQNAVGGDKPFDLAYLSHLRNVYRFMTLYGVRVEDPQLEEIIQERSTHGVRKDTYKIGTMARGRRATVPVLFRCRVPAELRPNRVCIVGNREELGEWIPNKVCMYDDGTHGDEIGGDGVWSISVDLPVRAEIHYKYTHDGLEGQWHPGDERVGVHRILKVADVDRMVVDDIFGIVNDKAKE